MSEQLEFVICAAAIGAGANSGRNAYWMVAHYAIGIVFAALLMGVWGLDWVRHPTLLPALLVGMSSIVAPFFIMQPAFGAGIAASKLPIRTLRVCAAS
ncbi:DUF2938 domain-containing protein [Mesorhizobium sp. M1312]|uniref:DUF2938 family protein n=1 Tax=unclassified Mesorhizobium TaxID=325217 RepID=UPI00333A3DA7